jgi:hypothetical protein
MSSITNSRAFLDSLTAGDTARQIAEAMGSTLVQREYEKSIASVLSAQTLGMGAYGNAHAKDLAALHSSTAMKDAIQEIASQQNLASILTATLGTSSLADAFGGQAAMREYANALDLASQVKKLAFGFDAGYAYRESLKVLESAASASKLAEAAGGLDNNLEYAKATASTDWVRLLSKSLVDDGLYKRFLNTLDIRHSVPSELWSSAAEIAHLRYEKLFTSPTAWASQIEQLKRPAYLDTLLQAIERDISAYAYPGPDFFVEEDTDNDDEALLQALGTAETPERFAELLGQCSKWLKWALINFLMFVVLPFAVSVSANLAMPYVEQCLKQSTAVTPREQIKEIKRLSMGELGVALRDCRFVTASRLVLRRTPNSRAEQVDSMHFGQVVTVISTKRDWTEISYEYGDGQAVTGWVFTRYLAKFRR